MRLIKFQVTNFRSVVDSGWIEADQVTALVGINESGKSNLLLALWKLNPAMDGEIQPNSDYPKSIFNRVDANSAAFDFVAAEFDASDVAGPLAEMTGLDEAAFRQVLVRRNFKGDRSVEFPLAAVTADSEEGQAAAGKLASKEVLEFVVRSMPSFVYYSNYGNLDSAIFLPAVVANQSKKDLSSREAARTRTLNVLFRFVELKPEDIVELGKEAPTAPGAAAGAAPSEQQIAATAEKKRKRANMLHGAAAELTKRFRDWWKQGDYTFDFVADGQYFRIWVSDAKRPERVELEDRSAGLQWFFSFYLVFLVESERAHKGAILLLDEPGLSLHPLAQRDLSVFFESLSKKSQLIYTTHSPFLVEADTLDRVRKVYMAEDGSTKASSNLRAGDPNPRKSGATYAIHSALGMNVAECILLGCQPVIVEGPSDQHYISAIKTLLIANGLITPRREIIFTPSHGASNAKVIASILSGREDEPPLVLLDGDETGRKVARELQNGIYQGESQRILLTDPYVGFDNSEIEDLFPPDFLAKIIDRWQRQANADVDFADVVKAGQPVVPQIVAWLGKNGVTPPPSGWKVDVARMAKARALEAKPGAFEAERLQRWVRLFEALLGA